MKKLLVALSLLVFVGVYAAPALTMPNDVAAKIVAVDKDKKDKKVTKSEVKSGTTEAKACCSETAKAGCASSCKEAAACKGEEKKK
jgi:hypothetical protein